MNNIHKRNSLRLIELFSGIGAQYTGLIDKKLFDVESVATSDLDKEVVVSYAAMHCGLTEELIRNYENYPSKEEMVKTLTDKRLGYDFKKDKPYDWAKLAKKKDITKGIEKYWLADKLSKNLGDITQVNELPDCNFLTYSAPCVDWSIAGQQEGGDWTCNDCGTKYSPYKYDIENRYMCPYCGSKNIKSTRSGLLFEVERLLTKMVDENKAPEYLLCENVDALVSKKFKPAWDAWESRLSDLNYNTYWTCINAKNTGVPQNRNRLIALSIRKDVDTGKFEFPQPFDSGLRLRDLLETDAEVLDKYFLSDEVQERLQITDPNFVKSIVGTTKPDFRTIGQSDLVYNKDGIMGTLLNRDYKQPKQIIDDNRCIHSGTLMGKYEKMMDVSRRVYDENGIAPAMHTCGGGNTEPKVSRDNLRIVRKLTPKECHRLMGFSDELYDRCKNIGMSDTQGYKQAGNSIVVNVISLVAEHLYKAQYDNTYKCYDENFTQPQED